MAEVLEHIKQTSAPQETNPLDHERPLLSSVPKNVDPTKFRLAYGRQGIPQLVFSIEEFL